MRFFSERRRLATISEEEARGKTFWTSEFPKPVRVKLLYAFRDCAPTGQHVEFARWLLLRDQGLLTLEDEVSPQSDFLQHLMKAPDALLPGIVEAMGVASGEYLGYHPGDPSEFTHRVNDILLTHRISFELIDGHMVPFESRELHQAVVVPTLQLLARQGWSSVEKAYQKALEELSGGDPADAITDAATALQEALTALGCKGNSLGPLAKDARVRALLAPHDSTLADGLQKIMDWVSADRSERGDAHTASSATRSDAWLTVHIVGALILRLADEMPRTAN